MVSLTGALALAAVFAPPVAANAAKPARCAQRLSSPPAVAATGARSLTARDLVELRDFGEVGVSPDGRWAALLLRRADVARDRYCLGLLIVAVQSPARPHLIDVGGEPMLVRGDLRGVADVVNGSIDDSGPIWSPDNRSIAYLKRDHGVTQVWIATRDGRARQLTRSADDVRAVEWVSRSAVRITLRATQAARAAILQEGRSGYHYDRRFWAISENGPGPVPTPLVYKIIDAANGRVVRDVEPAKPPAQPAGAQLFVALSGGGTAWTEPALPVRYAGPSVLKVAYRARRLNCGEPCSTRVAGVWATGPDTLVFLRSGASDNGGVTELYRWKIDRAEGPQRVLSTIDALSRCAMARDKLVCGLETARHPRVLVTIDPERGGIDTLFDPNPELTALIRNRVERLRWTGSDGIPSYGDLVLPPDHRPGERHPLVIVQYSSRGFLRGGVGDEYPIHLLAARGYAVLSVTRPQSPAHESDAADIDSFQRVNVAGWADRRRVLASLEAGIEAVLAKGVADPGAIGLTGLSDGGSTVQFALLNSGRFRAAAMSTCCESAGALSTVGLAYSDSTTKWGYPPPATEDRAFWAPYSLAANATTMRTPLLIQMADREYRLALETYAALDHAGAPVDMYVFPDEYHIKYHPTHRLAIYQRNVAWFDFWLRNKEDPEGIDPATRNRWRALRSGAAP